MLTHTNGHWPTKPWPASSGSYSRYHVLVSLAIHCECLSVSAQFPFCRSLLLLHLFVQCNQIQIFESFQMDESECSSCVFSVPNHFDHLVCVHTHTLSLSLSAYTVLNSRCFVFPHNSLRLLYIVNYLSFYSEDGFPLRTHNWIWTIQRSIDARLFKWTEHEPTHTHSHAHTDEKKAFEPDIFNYHSSIQLFWAQCKHTNLSPSFAFSRMLSLSTFKPHDWSHANHCIASFVSHLLQFSCVLNLNSYLCLCATWNGILLSLAFGDKSFKIEFSCTIEMDRDRPRARESEIRRRSHIKDTQVTVALSPLLFSYHDQIWI